MTDISSTYTLQVLSFYGESGMLGVDTAPIMGAMIDKFDDQYANTLVIGEGDSWIPGPWLVAGADPSLNAVPGIGSTALGRPDVAIMNAFGTDVSSLGNHEFDLGSPVLSGAIAASGAWAGAQFALVTSNLDFSADSSLRGLADASLGGTSTNAFAGKEALSIKGKIAPYAVVTQGGEKIGIVGATTYDLLVKSSPNGTVPKDDGNPSTSDLQEVAAYIQASVNSLRAMGINKIVMVDQLDTITRNQALAPLVSGIDIMVAGGGHERLGDATDTAAGFNGHDANFAGAFPIVTAGADGKPVLIVTTDTEYTYLGRLVANFDANGEIIVSDLDSAVSGAYASTETILQAAYGTSDAASTIIASSAIATKVQAIVNAIDNVVSIKDGNVFGYTKVYLEGDRVYGRAEEVNIGDLTADANTFKAATALGDGQPFLVSLKNGGGIRASIGAIDEDGSKIPPTATDVKPAGGISQLDIENALRFDNKLMVFDTTPQGLLNIFNYAAGLAAGNGGYAQVGGIRYSYDPDFAAGAKIVSMSLTDQDGNIIARIVEKGVVVAGAPSTISVVCLNFTTNGGDGYPIKANASNFRYLLNDGTLSAAVNPALDFTAESTMGTVGQSLATVLGEQKALQDFLLTNHATPETAYDVADTVASLDQRIENLNRRVDDVVMNQTHTGSDASEAFVGGHANDIVDGKGGVDSFSLSNVHTGYRLVDLGDDRFVLSDLRTGNYDGQDTLSHVESIVFSDVTMKLGTGANDVIVLSGANDFVNAGAGDDQIKGLAGDDELSGGSGNDILLGGKGNDVLMGGDGNDNLRGETGQDVLVGGKGVDVLQGGTDADLFAFDAGDSGMGAGNRDRILGFETGIDHIDLSSIADAHVVISAQRGMTFIAQIDTNNDNAVDMQIEVKTLFGSLTLSDFIL